MLRLGLEAAGRAEPCSKSQAKAEPQPRLIPAYGLGFNFCKPQAMAQAVAWRLIFVPILLKNCKISLGTGQY